MKKVIIFDFWGTLAENGVWSPIKQVRNVLALRMPFSEYVITMEKAMMVQKHENLGAAFDNVCSTFNIQCDEEKRNLLIGLWNKNWMLAEPYAETKKILEKLKKEFTLVLVSNTDQFSINNVLDKFELRDLFHHIFLSCDLGLIKSDPAFFEKIVSEVGVSKEDCVMVGDSIQSDIISAKAAGLSAILIDRRNTRDYHPKIQNLDKLKEVINSL